MAWSEAAFEEVVRTAEPVRAVVVPPARRARPRLLPRAALIVTAFGAAVAALALPQPHVAHADYSADADLFSLTNQDRASNGVYALRQNGTLQSIGENASYTACGSTHVNGRSEDMIQRNYFSHYIPPCGQTVFPMMKAFGVNYGYAGENIGWVSGYSSPGPAAQYINNAFMNSSDHRANILSRNYTDLGIGSWYTNGPWTGGGGSSNDVYMFSEEFASIGSPPPPAPKSNPAPAPPPRNAPAPPAPAQPAATAAPTPPPPTPVPTPTLVPTPTTTPGPGGGTGPPLPFLYTSQGVISDTVETVLQGFLVN